MIKITNFPKFLEYYRNTPGSWLSTLHNNGYPSAKMMGDYNYELNDLEYTHFVLRWT